MQEAARGLELAVASGGGVLLCGESGTGRDLFARAIHTATHDGIGSSVESLLKTSMGRVPNGQPFVVVDCATTQNLEHRFFGSQPKAQEPGALDTEHITEGCALHEALSGTLIIRHLTEMPGRVQARLARILRDKEVVVESRQGQLLNTPAIFRPIATITVRPEGNVEDQLLPELRERLAQTVITIPPLRDRREDLPAIIRVLLVNHSISLALPTRTASSQATALLSALPWRGNLDELGGLLKALVLKVPGRQIRLADVLANIQLDGGPTTLVYGSSLKDAREQFEREYVRSVLEQHHGRMGEAAKILGIQRTNLYRKVRQLSVARSRVGHRSRI